MTKEEIIKDGCPLEPNCFETDAEETWYNVGLYHGATANPWISVKERLPEFDETILASYESAFLEITSRHKQDKSMSFLDKNGFVVQRNGGRCTGDIVHVDYWMPIPATPKEESEKNDTE